MPDIFRIVQNQVDLLRRHLRGFLNWRHARLSGRGRGPKGFVSLPEPCAIGSYAKGQQLLSKNFMLARELVVCENLSFWAVTAPSKAFEREQHGFAWIDDLVAVGDGAARKLAQQWVFDWIDIYGKGRGAGWQPGITGRRVIHMISHAKFLQSGLDEKNTQKFLKSLGKQAEYLTRRWRAAQHGLHRVEALTGLIFAGLALHGKANILNGAIRALGQECQTLIGKDGGIQSRNPDELKDIFVLLTWVAKTLEHYDHPVAPEISKAMQRMAPTLRGLRLGDGTLVRFHGGAGVVDAQLDQALADAQVKDNRSDKLLMGFERLSAARLIVVADCAAPQPNGRLAHASTLGFEMSSGRRPMLVNCGAGQKFGADWPRLSRQTQCHNSLQIDTRSSAEFSDDQPSKLKNGPLLVSANRANDLTGAWMVAAHDGFSNRFGLTHERRLFVSADGRELSGEDQLSARDQTQKNRFQTVLSGAQIHALGYALHFHLHPDVDASLDQSGHAVSLSLLSGEIWVFRQIGGQMALQDAMYLDPQHLKPRATKKIVVTSQAAEVKNQITWNFLRAADGGRNTRDLVADGPTLNS